jgi:hypothetical protein
VVLFADKRAGTPTADEEKEAAERNNAAQQFEAVFYRPGDLLPQLQVPLGVTLSATPPKPNRFEGREAQRVDTLTRDNVFSAAFQFAVAEQSLYLILDRAEPDG